MRSGSILIEGEGCNSVSCHDPSCFLSFLTHNRETHSGDFHSLRNFWWHNWIPGLGQILRWHDPIQDLARILRWHHWIPRLGQILRWQNYCRHRFSLLSGQDCVRWMENHPRSREEQDPPFCSSSHLYGTILS